MRTGGLNSRRWRWPTLISVVAMQICACTEPAARPPFARGLYNWVHTTGDAERAFRFYREVLGIQLAGSPFAPAGAAPEGIRPVADAGSDELVWQLTNTRGSRYRTVFMRAANTPFGLELAEFFDIARGERSPNAWDPGASMVMFEVRDLDAAVVRLRQRDTPIITLGGMPLDTPAGRSVLVRDPDGYLVRLTQASPAAIAAAREAGEVVATSIGVTVADTRAALGFYRDLLGFDARAPRSANSAELALYGLADGRITLTPATIPGTGVAVVFGEFHVQAGTAPPNPYRWKIQDVGAPQFQLKVADLDSLLMRTRDAGYGFLSVDGLPIQRAFGRFVFARDPDGVLVEYVEPVE
jgi:catechol 2,3-dioxygenase-like lactoylglutathione lyase family enzyme